MEIRQMSTSGEAILRGDSVGVTPTLGKHIPQQQLDQSVSVFSLNINEVKLKGNC